MKLRNTASLLLALALVLSPATTMAKNDKNKSENHQEVRVKVESHKEKEHKDDKDRRGNQSCLKAFGHLIAPGWIKKHGVPETDPNCVLPFGIAKKFFRSPTTTPPVVDTIAPVISNIVERSGTNFAVITWNTNEKTSGKLFWSATSPVNIGSANVISTTFKSTFHFALITGLSASTTYHAVITAKDGAGNTSTSSEFSFTTGGGTVIVVDTTPPVISSISSTVGTSTMSVSWQTNEAADSKVYYSTTSPISTSTASFVSNSSLVTNHSLNLSGLSTSTLYYLLIESKDSSGNGTTSSQFATTTLGA